MSSRSSRRGTQRLQALTVAGAVHPHPAAVVDPLFLDSAFFDPNDLVQVKYEMLRSVQVGARTGSCGRRSCVRPVATGLLCRSNRVRSRRAYRACCRTSGVRRGRTS
jgi:hypothetical protein